MVVLAESLCRRLPGCPTACAAAMHNLLHGHLDEDEAPDDWQREDAVCTGSVHTSVGGGHPSVAGTPGRGAGEPAAQSEEVGGEAGERGGGACVVFRPWCRLSSPESRLAVGSVLCLGGDGGGAAVMEEADAALALGLGRGLGRGGLGFRAGAAGQAGGVQGSTRAGGTPLKGVGSSGRPGQGVGSSVEEDERRQLLQRCRQRYEGLVQRVLLPYWPQASLREWVYTLGPRPSPAPASGRSPSGSASRPWAVSERQGSALGAKGGKGGQAGPVAAEDVVAGAGAVPAGLCNRMYVQHAEGELRMALVLCSAGDPGR